METKQRSRRDSLEIKQHEHDEALDARRVTIVGDAKLDLDIDTSKVTEAITGAIQSVDFGGRSNYSEVVEREIKVIEVPVQVFVPQIETKIIEVPVQTIVTEYQVVEVEKPIITESVKIVEVEKLITIQNYKERVPAWAWSLLITQIFVIGGLVYKLLS